MLWYFLEWSILIRHFRNEKATGTLQLPQLFLGSLLETRRSAIGYFLFPEVFAKVNLTQFFLSFLKWWLRLHPRRPRGSQSGREKRRDESFQVRAEEPLGTDSHRTISKNSSGCRLLIGHKKCFVLLCPIGEQLLLSSFREFVHDGYCLATLAWFVHQACAYKGNFYFLVPNQKQRNYRWVEKTFGLLSARAIEFAPRIFCFWRITIKMRRRWEIQISNSLTRQNNNFARASRFFVHFFAVNCTTTRENA